MWALADDVLAISSHPSFGPDEVLLVLISQTSPVFKTVFKGIPTYKYENLPIIDVLVNNKIASSRREAREFLTNNAISLNGVVINDENTLLDEKRKYNILRRGKKKYYLIEKES